LVIACDILERRFDDVLNIIEKDELDIIQSQNTMANSYDIILKNEDYTIGKVLEFMLYHKFYENMQLLTFCGFKKMHPHDEDSIIRIAYSNTVDKNIIKGHLIECANDAKQVFKKMGKDFLKFMKN